MKSIIQDIKKNPVPYLLLLVIILFGLYLRAYHANYPVIGYHNWKETHYLTEARNFAREGFFKHGFFVPENDYPVLGGDPSGAHADTFPTISILVAIAFKIFGMNLAVARSIGILFGLGSIFAMYLLTKELFGRDDIALVSATLTAINPLLVFFSHNVQLINPALFFMLVGTYFYLKWSKSNEKIDITYAAIFIALAGLTKYTFLIILVPILLTMKKEQIKDMFNIKKYWVSYLFLSLIPIWFIYNLSVGARTGKYTTTLSSIGIKPMFKVAWWSAMKNFTIDNYTTLGILFALIGLLAIIYFNKKKEAFAERFILSYALGAFLFIILLSDKVGGHSYHQYPIAPLFIILISYSFLVIGDTLSETLTLNVEKKDKDKNKKLINFVIILILLILIYRFGSIQSIHRQFDTQFPGLDIAGTYINQHSSPNERLIFSGGQSFGVLWYADRKGYYDINSVEDIKKAESLGSDWIFVYLWGLNDVGTKKWDYISKNYHLVQVGFMRTQKGDQLVYLLLKKGGTFNINQLQSIIQNKPVQSKEYERTNGKYKFYYVDV